jgi:hypothetical protein
VKYRIIFENGNAATIYHSMAEGMWETARDDYDSADRARDLDALLKEIDPQWLKPAGAGVGFNVIIPGDLAEIARAVLENCLDNYGGDDEDTLEDGDVTIEEEA